MSESDSLLDVQGLQTHFYLEEGVLKAVDDVSFSISKNATLGIIGESGCGKSVTALSVLRIVSEPGRVAGGRMIFRRRDGNQVDLAMMPPDGREIRSIRGKEITMVFQEPMTSFSPVHTIGNQIMESVLEHVTDDKAEAARIAADTLRKVGITNAEQRLGEYPYQLSGGLRQRAMIAMALVCNPSLLIADEPTTALDVTVQAQILKLIRNLQDQFGMAVMYITHDLGVVAEVADTVVVMYLGRVVESGPVREIFHNPLHPYTRLLLESIPKVGKKAKTRLNAIKGTVPLPLNMPPRCGFAGRCPEAIVGRCNTAIPQLVTVAPEHQVRCYLHSDESVSVAEGELEHERQ